MKAFVPLLLCSLLAGCATYQWRHGDGTRNFDAESYPCKQEAAKAFPPEMRERVARAAMFQPPRCGQGWPQSTRPCRLAGPCCFRRRPCPAAA